MFEKVLIANRGEIALRIHRACHEMGIKTVAVHSTADTDAMHVRLADESGLHRPAAGARQLPQHPRHHLGRRDHRRRRDPSRLRLPLGERALRRIVEAHGIIFIGPKPEHIRMMGDKIEAKQTARELGLPLVPGSPGPVDSLEEARRWPRRSAIRC